MDVMLIRKDNIKSDYAARRPSLTGLTIILKSNVLLFFHLNFRLAWNFSV